ncbi:MAG TPA: glycosyltransferase family 39 protein [Gemmatimonadaceae bacterium]|nr:glycosyltransferase family 39 protein [Gemmatimonadaceae bacterium]
MTDDVPRDMRISQNAVLALVLAVAAAVFVYMVWGGLDRPGLYHDEKAYVLQSRIYLGLHFAEASPPVPQLWEQVHVFTQPHYAARYPPGFPAVLAIGSAIGMPGLIPILCSALTAALLFLFGQQFTGRWTAFVATSLWLAAPINTEWRATYFSESLTCLLWVSWCYFAWRYRTHGRRRDLIFTSLLVAFAGITRPVTAIALAIPLIAILWPRIRTAIGRRDTLVAAAAGLVICAVVPFWNHAVLDSWTTVPYAEYSARTYPFDMPTWKTDWSPAPRELPPDMVALGEAQRIGYSERSASALPGLYAHRLNRFASDAVPFKYRWLRYIAPIGLLLLGGAGWVGLASALLLVLAHITMPHAAHWTIYYVDVFPVVAFGAVFALRRLLDFLAWGSPRITAMAPHAPAAALTIGLSLLLTGGSLWRPDPIDKEGWMQREMPFRALVCALPPGEKIVFVRARPGASPHHMLVDNDPRWRTSKTWIVREWTTERNRALIEAAPARAAYIYDEKAGWMALMNRDGTASTQGVISVRDVDWSTGRGLWCR